MTHLGSGPLSPPRSYARKGACSTKIFPAWRGGLGFRAEAEFTAEPGPGEDPVPVRTAGGDPKGRGRLLARETGEVAQLDEPGLERILFRQPPKRRVKGQQVHRGFRRGDRIGVHVLATQAAAVLAG